MGPVLSRLDPAVSTPLTSSKRKSVLAQEMEDAPKLSLVASLPAEVLSTVFKSLVRKRFPERGPGDEEPTDEELESPADKPGIVVSHVCKAWRKVALDTTALWRRITVWRYTPLEKTQELLRRSKTAPLDIEIDLSRACVPLRGVRQLNLLVDHVNRWQTFSWACDRYGITSKLAIRLRGLRAPLLQTFTIFNHEKEDRRARHLPRVPQKEVYPIFNGTSSIPSLRWAEIVGVPLDWRLSPLAGLTRLELSDMPKHGRLLPSQFAQLLRLSPLLQSLTIHKELIKASAEDLEEPEAPTVLPELTSVTLKDFSDPGAVTNLFMFFRAPHLLELTCFALSTGCEDNPLDLTATLNLLASRTEDLKLLMNVAFSHVDVDSSRVFERFFCALPALRRFSITRFGTDSPGDNFSGGVRVFRTFFAPELRQSKDLPALSVAVPCPHLETITTTGYEGNTLLVVAIGRARVGHPLKSVRYDLATNVQEVAVKNVQAVGTQVIDESFCGEADEDAEGSDDVYFESEDDTMASTKLEDDHLEEDNERKWQSLFE